MENAIRKLCGEVSGQALPKFTALSKKSRLVLLPSDKPEPLEMLDLVGREIVRYQSWGRNGRILDSEQFEKNFNVDHDLMKEFLKGRTAHPRRIAFGLPHNYGNRPN